MASLISATPLLLSPLRLPNPKLPFPFRNPNPISLLLRRNPNFPRLRITASSFSSSSLQNPTNATLLPNHKNPPNPNPNPLLSTSTRTLASLLSLALLLLRRVLPSPPAVRALALSAGPLFFAALRDRPSGYLNTPLTVVASGMAKWLDIYSGVLMIRVLLSWFPNIPWDRQPLSAIRDLCDPYLNLFRNIIPPVFDTLDVSPLLAFAVLGTLGSILNSNGMKG
ncbi:putative protein COFACTOR ASSEMBLY OF COMPLEX C SUBUNIT B CCB3, chloroplastic [Iris pallida]|uniref:Uncharacterized protein n=1 Tax=Iris pallida TaxID=29817 RepID=A0AAX6H4K8_IRIPA|nr:putative protein COFACTOR ASSEMBLY OF COMPLEX C SUBUNIT B CCB3, chloroplastic [Iris pallida]